MVEEAVALGPPFLVSSIHHAVTGVAIQDSWLKHIMLGHLNCHPDHVVDYSPVEFFMTTRVALPH